MKDTKKTADALKEYLEQNPTVFKITSSPEETGLIEITMAKNRFRVYIQTDKGTYDSRWQEAKEVKGKIADIKIDGYAWDYTYKRLKVFTHWRPGK